MTEGLYEFDPSTGRLALVSRALSLPEYGHKELLGRLLDDLELLVEKHYVFELCCEAGLVVFEQGVPG